MVPYLGPLLYVYVIYLGKKHMQSHGDVGKCGPMRSPTPALQWPHWLSHMVSKVAQILDAGGQ